MKKLVIVLLLIPNIALAHPCPQFTKKPVPKRVEAKKHPVEIRYVVTPCRKTWFERNAGWVLPAAVLTAGVVGYNLRGERTRVVTVRSKGHDDD